MSQLRTDLVGLIADPIPFLEHADPVLARIATRSLSPDQVTAHSNTLIALLGSPDTGVRAAAAEQLGHGGTSAQEHLLSTGDDPEPEVREAVVTALGETTPPHKPGLVEWLADVAQADDARTVREAAVAALGALGDPSAVDALLRFVASGPPQVRRRAIAAITVFDDDRIEPALIAATLDRNPGVREAAEMVVGKQLRDD